MKPTCPLELRRLYQQGRIIPFIGAGASMALTWKTHSGTERRGPSWSELVGQATRILGADDPDILRCRGTDLQILEYLKIKFNGTQRLINWLHAEMQPEDDNLKRSVLHGALAGLEKCRLFYTTNYDDFLERSLTLSGRAVSTVASEHDLSKVPADTQVVKFHGDFDNPARMVLSESDYERRMSFHDELDLKLRSEILGRALLFVGYSFRDANVAYLFRLVTDRFGQLPQSFAGRRAYIIYPNPSDFERQLFHARQIEVVPVIGNDTASLVAEVLRQMAE